MGTHFEVYPKSVHEPCSVVVETVVAAVVVAAMVVVAARVLVSVREAGVVDFSM